MDAAGIPPDQISFPHALAAATATVAAFPPEQAGLAFATFLAKVLMAAFFTRDRPGRAARVRPRRPAASPPASQVSPASRKSPAQSSSTCSAPGGPPESNAIGT